MADLAFDVDELIRLRKAELAEPENAAAEKAFRVYLSDSAKWGRQMVYQVAPLARTLADCMMELRGGKNIETRMQNLEAAVAKLKPKRKYKKRKKATKREKKTQGATPLTNAVDVSE